MPSTVVWDRREESHRRAFASLLAPLVVASRSKDFEGERAKTQLHAWMLSLQDVTREVLAEAIDRLVTRGVTWMPKPGDVRKECADVITERRKALAPRAQAITAECDYCQGSGFEPITVDGVDHVRPCGCRARVRALYEGLPEPIALPPAPEDAA
jgi:hypothetical protein